MIYFEPYQPHQNGGWKAPAMDFSVGCKERGHGHDMGISLPFSQLHWNLTGYNWKFPVLTCKDLPLK
jgi:hypothetical protein